MNSHLTQILICLFKVPGILPPQEVITIAIGMNDVLKVLKFTIMLAFEMSDLNTCS